MKKATPLFAISFGVLFVVLMTLRDSKDYKNLKLMQDESSISNTKMTGIYNLTDDRINLQLLTKAC